LSSQTTRTLPSTTTGVFDKIACIGTGKMAQAIIDPLIRTGLQPAHLISIYDVSNTTMTAVQKKYGVQTSESVGALVKGADLILCAVKPQNLTAAFFAELHKGHNVRDDAILLSVVAGKPISVFQGPSGLFQKVVRSMPNTPAQVGQGMTVWSCTDTLTAADRQKIESMLSSCGKSMYVDDEAFIDMATSISGSGPAYIFLLMESMIDGGMYVCVCVYMSMYVHMLMETFCGSRALIVCSNKCQHI
jgi:pyrroline-5-carboxylate reductase